jgi:hypothetical protein
MLKRTSLSLKVTALLQSVLLFLAPLSPLLQAQTPPAAERPWNFFPEALTPELYEMRVVQLLELSSRMHEALDLRDFIPDELGRSLSTPSDALAWINGETRPLPYLGKLRGERGVLQDRRGNHLDRALLLAEMVAAQGFEVRLERATLSEAAARALFLENVFAEFTPRYFNDMIPEVEEAVVESLVELLELDPEAVERFLEFNQKAGSEMVTSIRDVVDALEKSLDQVLGQEGLDRNVPWDEAAAVASLTDYWWVSYWGEEGWTVLAPGIDDLAQLPEPLEFHQPGDIPSELIHTVIYQIVATVSKGGEIEEVILTSAEVETPLVRQSDGIVEVKFLPLGYTPPTTAEFKEMSGNSVPFIESLLAVKEWLPVIEVRNEVFAEFSIDRNGNVNADFNLPAEARALGQAMEALLGFDPPEAEESQLLSLRLKISLREPAGQTELDDRVFFDKPGSDWSRLMDNLGVAGDNDLRITAGFLQSYHFFQQTFSPAELYFKERFWREVRQNEPLLLTLLLDRELPETLDQLIPREGIPSAIMNFLILRQKLSGGVQAEAPTGPSLIGYSELIVAASPTETRRFRVMDIAHSAFMDLSPDRSAVRRGLEESVLERIALKGLTGDGRVVAQVFDLHPGETDINLKLLDPDQGSELAIVVKRSLERGNIILTDAQLSPYGYWWEFNPQTGSILIRDSLGRGSVVMEEQILGGVYFSLLMAFSGLIKCVATGGFLPCCVMEGIAMGTIGFGVGAGVGFLFGATAALWFGVGFDIVTSPFAPDGLPNARCDEIIRR